MRDGAAGVDRRVAEAKPAPWYIGATAIERRPVPRPHSSALAMNVSERDRCEMTTPLGRPVVPEVYATQNGSCSATATPGSREPAAARAASYDGPSESPSMLSTVGIPAPAPPATAASASSSTSAREPECSRM